MTTRHEPAHSRAEKKYILRCYRVYLDLAGPTDLTPDWGTLLAYKSHGYTPERAIRDYLDLPMRGWLAKQRTRDLPQQ